MKIQKSIMSMMSKKLKGPRSQPEPVKPLSSHKGNGDPGADAVELLAKGMRMTPLQLASGETAPIETAFALISGMVDCLHPATQRLARLLLEELRQLFRESEELYARHACWQYAVTEPRPSHFALKAAERTGKGWLITPVESEPFTDDRSVAEAAAELFTRCALSPIHLDEALKDYMTTL